MVLNFIFEHIPILKQLPHFSSYRVFGTYPSFETITGMSIFKHLRTFETKQDLMKFLNINKIENKTTLFLYNFKIITALKIQILILFCSYNN